MDFERTALDKTQKFLLRDQLGHGLFDDEVRQLKTIRLAIQPRTDRR